MAYVNAKEEDVKIIKSPVGMPGRALHNTSFVRLIETEDWSLLSLLRAVSQQRYHTVYTGACVSGRRWRMDLYSAEAM